MAKLLAAFSLGVVVTAASAWLWPHSTPSAAPAPSASCTTSDDDVEMPNPRTLDNRLDKLESEINGDAGR